MSYDIDLVPPKAACEHCGRSFERPGHDWSPTYNLTPIFDLAFTGEELPNANVSEAAVVLIGTQTDRPRGLRLLDGKRAGDTIETICNALLRLEKDPERFRKLEPANKWGTYEDALEVLAGLRELATNYPEHRWEIR